MSVLIGAELSAFAAANLAAAGSQLVTIPGGTFMMGSANGCDDERPMHKATISTFRMGRDDVTNEEWGRFADALGDRRVALIGAHPDTGVERVLALGKSRNEVRSAVDRFSVTQLFPDAGDIVTIGGLKTFVDSRRTVEIEDHKSPAGFDRPRQPVVCVNWDESFVYAFLHGGMLPTEWQFEYAARVMQTGNGNDLGPYRTGTRVIQGNELREYATLTGRLSKAEAHYDAGTTADVGSYPRLSNGLGDMCGNVWKWMQNWYGSYSKDAVTDPAGPASGEVKSVRGGSWRSSDFPEVLRAAVRFDGYTGGRYDFFGFRVAAPQDSGKAL